MWRNVRRMKRGLVVLAFVAGVALAGCSASGPVKGTPAPTHAVAAASTPTATATARAALGTRANPFPLNTPGKYDPASMWTFTFTAVNGDAWPTVKQDDPELNEAPDPGTTYVLGTVKIDAGTSETAENPETDLNFNYVGSDGNTYPADPDQCGDLGSTDLTDATDMYSGASRTFSICAQVPIAAAHGGTWAINYVDGTSPTAFFKGA